VGAADLARRVANYVRNGRSTLLTGAVAGDDCRRIRPHSKIRQRANGESFPRVAPITFFVRDEADWMIRIIRCHQPEGRGLSEERAGAGFLRQRGASFFADIVGHG